MQLRWLLASISLHGLLLGGAWWCSSSSSTAPELVLQAPLGEVFVQEVEQSAAPNPAPSSPLETASPETSPLGTEPSSPSPALAASSSNEGVPDGEAVPAGRVEPSYPEISRKLGEEGEVTFLLEINSAGDVTAAELVSSSGHPRLDEAAKQALLAARFRAAVRDGIAAASQKRFHVEFRLRSRKKPANP